MLSLFNVSQSRTDYSTQKILIICSGHVYNVAKNIELVSTEPLLPEEIQG